ncbi:DUF3224 domain-containing protein [Kitasatospora sp. NPDC088351]|uniref:DUF3224 domain-containing protein n=1 Tax=unclassified Kitasatospora TaxID=2633591 RepID=UPI00343BF498
MPTQTSGRFTFANWEEAPVGPADGTPRLAHASVANSFTGGIEAAGTTCEYAIVYVGESVGTFTGMEVVTGAVDGRKGSFALEERGTFDAEATRCTFEVVPGSGTGELAGLRGTGSFTSRHGTPAVEYTFGYELG